MESVGWLKAAVQAGPVELDAKLQRYYKECEHSPEAGIRERLQRLCTREQLHLAESLGLVPFVRRRSRVERAAGRTRRAKHQVTGGGARRRPVAKGDGE